MKTILKYEFDTMKEWEKVMKNLSDYHDCDDCHGKIVCIMLDGLGNTLCGYCGQIVKYPKLKREAFEKYLLGRPMARTQDS